MTRTYEIRDDLDPNLRLLAEAVLTRDPSAVRGMVDCFLENDRGGPRITPQYVERLEDLLRDYKTYLRGVVRSNESERLERTYFTLEREARQLGRQGLS